MVAASVSRQSEGASIEVMLDRGKWYGAVVVHWKGAYSAESDSFSLLFRQIVCAGGTARQGIAAIEKTNDQEET